MTAEMAILQDKIAAAEKAKAVLVQANTKLHLEFRTLSEELNSQSAKTLKRNEKLAEKTKTYRLESARMKAQITHLESELVETAKTRWRQRLDGANF
jgi:chromosome segregation ATPase